MTSSNENEKLDVALIGCGRIAQTHLQAILANSEFRLLGVADLQEGVAESVIVQYGLNSGCKAYKDYNDILNENDIHAVIVCTPPNTHAEITSCFLDKGVHVLCEKPLAVSCNEAEILIAKARENNCILMMASKFRYVEDIIMAKAIVESGILGDIILFENVFCSRVDMSNRWNSVRDIAGGGVLIDNGCHSVDIARYLVGPISKVQAEEGKRVQKLDVEDTVRLYVRTETDAMGAIDLSWSIHKEQESYIDLFGTEGVLSIGWKCSRYRQSEKMNWVTFGKGYNKFDAFSSQMRNFAGVIKGREKPLITAEDSLESVKVISTAYNSAGMNKWVEVQ